jgi:hypothetical protein
MSGHLDKWWFWVTSVISVQMHWMHLHRRVWLDLQEILARNESLPPSYWWVFMSDSYGVTQAVAVRRQVDRRRDVVSLARLLIDVKAHSDLLTEQYFSSRFDQSDAAKMAWAANHWRSSFAGNSGNHLDPAYRKAT